MNGTINAVIAWQARFEKPTDNGSEVNVCRSYFKTVNVKTTEVALEVKINLEAEVKANVID